MGADSPEYGENSAAAADSATQWFFADSAGRGLAAARAGSPPRFVPWAGPPPQFAAVHRRIRRRRRHCWSRRDATVAPTESVGSGRRNSSRVSMDVAAPSPPPRLSRPGPPPLQQLTVPHSIEGPGAGAGARLRAGQIPVTGAPAGRDRPSRDRTGRPSRSGLRVEDGLLQLEIVSRHWLLVVAAILGAKPEHLSVMQRRPGPGSAAEGDGAAAA
jgi:hypothetical protein